jgi:threonine/homoserine efflux transporter RhtA
MASVEAFLLTVGTHVHTLGYTLDRSVLTPVPVQIFGWPWQLEPGVTDR